MGADVAGAVALGEGMVQAGTLAFAAEVVGVGMDAQESRMRCSRGWVKGLGVKVLRA